MIVWNGFDIVCLIIFGIFFAILGVACLIFTIQDKIDKHFEKREK